ncbi:aminoglycoside phosphotransferase family protein [Gordonia sp. L191]|uniref:phosphotransferase family protein n=1 Tax=Gordonia sp. L191 TaxID=2982699 RepID=UPI0024C00803|nr:aminoglycoside phosphotransferase family protein [Gordonia sp. L191]WHU46879.1 aminoglycoside phosphotransferase family protein [Gordonia sp. L191]
MTETEPHNPGAPALIDSVAEIEAAWIQSVLRASGIPGATVRSVTSAPIGAGNVSDTVRVTIDYVGERGDAPESVVVKLKPSDPAVHEHGLNSGAYHREIGGYRDISDRLACRIPLKYWVNGDETTINLVMEDLTGTTTPGNQITGCGPAEAEAVVVELARLHSEFFPLTDATAPAWMIRLPEVCEYWSSKATRGATAALERFSRDLSEESLDVIREAGDLVRDWHLLPHRRLTFTHGDPRVDNILFEPLADGVGAVIIDWQVTGLRNPMYDVGYFLSGSVEPEVRRTHEMRLIRRYVEEFASKSDGYNETTAVADYQIQLLSGLYITLAAIDVLPDNEVVNTLILALLRRNCAAAIDWHSVAALRNVTSVLSVG